VFGDTPAGSTAPAAGPPTTDRRGLPLVGAPLADGKLVRLRSPHTWPEGVDPPVPYPIECEVCGFRLPSDTEPLPLCRGDLEERSRLGRSELSRKSPIRRKSALRPVSPTNSGREHQIDRAYRRFVRRRYCAGCGALGPSEAHHVRSWGSGHGDWLDDGTGNLAPLCRGCHDLFHRRGRESFAELTGVDLEHEAKRIGERYRTRKEEMNR